MERNYLANHSCGRKKKKKHIRNGLVDKSTPGMLRILHQINHYLSLLLNNNHLTPGMSAEATSFVSLVAASTVS